MKWKLRSAVLFALMLLAMLGAIVYATAPFWGLWNWWYGRG